MKTHRLVARATDAQVTAIWAAAELEGILPSEFIRLAAVEKAHQVIERYQRCDVSREAAAKILAAIDSTTAAE